MVKDNLNNEDSYVLHDKPLVTIVTPSLNQGEFIEETIKSVLCQTYNDIEYIVMDGGSVDNTIKILEKYAKNIIWVSEPDQGQTDAINKGLKRSAGEYFCYLNSDDTLEKDAIKDMVTYLETHPESSLVYGDADYIDENSDVITTYDTYEWNFKKLKERCFICQPATLLRKKTIEDFGYFDESLHYIMDYEYWLRIAKNGGVISYLPKKLANSRLYENTKTMSCRGKVFDEVFAVTGEMFGETSYQWYKAYALYLATEKLGYLKLAPDSVVTKIVGGAILLLLSPRIVYYKLWNIIMQERYLMRN